MNKEKIAAAVKTASQVAVVIAALTLGVISHDIYLKVKSSYGSDNRLRFENPKTIGETSVALNERGELMVIDRATGECRLYQDSVGRVIFNMYASRIYTKKIEQQ